MRVFEPKKHNDKIGVSPTKCSQCNNEKQVDRIRDSLKDLKELLKEDNQELI